MQLQQPQPQSTMSQLADTLLAHKDEIIDLTERVLHVRGIECDDRISKLSEEKLKEILEEVRKLRRRRKGMDHQDRTEDDDDSDSSSKKEALYIR
jgi:hypothetical protein